uniref:Uncharacterized protein n=1 Tax=Rhodnius prolixus TaxID=13249 RepID=A0A905QWS1_RHOPR
MTESRFFENFRIRRKLDAFFLQHKAKLERQQKKKNRTIFCQTWKEEFRLCSGLRFIQDRTKDMN